MTTQAIDPVQFKAQQEQDWDGVAQGWKKWWAIWEKGAQVVSDALVEKADLQPGHVVLDVAAGIGEPAVTAARRVGPTGKVIATDLSRQMIAIGKERTAQLGLNNLEFQIADGESIDFSPEGFDAVLSRWGVIFFPDIAGALKNFYRLLKRGGCIAISSWSRPEKAPFISLPMAIVRRELELPAPPPDMPGPFSMCCDMPVGYRRINRPFYIVLANPRARPL